MKRIFLTTALASLLAVPMAVGVQTAGAAGASDPLPMHTDFVTAPSPQALEASDLIGARVYVSAEAPDQPVTDIIDDWDDIGEVHDILITRDGTIEAALVDVGGFLGIGEKTVAVAMDALDIVTEKDGQGWFVVFPGDRTMLEAAPAFEPATDQAAMTPTESRVDGKQSETERTAENDLEQWLEDGVYVAPMPDVALYGHADVPNEELNAEMLTGAPVYDSKDERIGSLDRLVLTRDGQIETGVIDVGGVLGIGAKPVAVDFESMTIQRDESEMLRVYVDISRKEMEEMPAYSG